MVSRPERRSWKSSQRAASHRTSRKQTSRWLMSLLSVLLLIVFTVLIWRIVFARPMPTRIVSILTGQNRKLSLPAIPFADRDLDPLRRLPWGHVAVADLSGLQEADGIQRLGDELRRQTTDGSALIVYLSAHGLAHRTSMESADLAGRDFRIQQPSQNCYSLTTLLDQLKQAKARTILLVLNTGYLTSDLRLGMFANEFVRAMKQTVHHYSDPRIWVLASHDLGQRSLDDHQKKATLFGQLVSAGLAGAADQPVSETKRRQPLPGEGDRDGYIDLDELYRYVADQCRALSDGTQTPILLNAGQSQATWKDAEDIRLIQLASLPEGDPEPLNNDEPMDDETPSTTASAPNETAAESVAVDTALVAQTSDAVAPDRVTSAQSGDSGTADQTNDNAGNPNENASSTAAEQRNGSEQPVAENEAKAETSELPDAALTTRELLHAAWRYRDRLAAANRRRSWSPIEYAPHLWRELERLLLDFQRLSWQHSAHRTVTQPDSAPSSDAASGILSQSARAQQASLQLQIQQHVDGLRRLAELTEAAINGGGASDPAFDPAGNVGQPATGDRLVVDRLWEAAHPFLKQRQHRKEFEADQPELQQVARAVRQFRQTCYRLMNWLRWYEQAALTVSSEDVPFQRLTDSLAELVAHLTTFRDQWQRHWNQPMDNPTALLSARDAFVRYADQLQQGIQLRIDDALRSPERPRSRHQLIVFLDSPLPTATQRLEILDRLELTAWQRADTDPVRNIASGRDRLQPSQRRWLGHTLRLYERVLRLAEADQLSRFASKLDQATGVTGSRQVDWPTLRAAGKDIAGWFESLPTRTGTEERSPNVSLALVDGRDASQLNRSQVGYPRLGVLPKRVTPNVQANWQAEEGLTLSTERDTQVRLQLRANTKEIQSVNLAIVFDERAVTVRLPQSGDQPVRSGRKLPVSLAANQTAELTVSVRANRTVPAGEGNDRRELVAHTDFGNVPLTCVLPKPNEVELVARRIGSRQAERAIADDVLQLATHPNRTSYFRLALRNLSGRKRTVNVQLFALRLSRRAMLPPGRLVRGGRVVAAVRNRVFEPASDVVLPAVEPIARTAKPLPLPAGGDARPIPFQLNRGQPASATNDSDGDNPAGDAAAAAPVDNQSASQLPLDTSTGLVCVITEVAPQGQSASKWIRWMELRAMSPRDYLDVEASYRVANHRLAVRVQPKVLPDDTGQDQQHLLPLGLAERPLQLELDVDRLRASQFQIGGFVKSGTILRPDDRVLLYAEVEPENDRVADVRLDVDGYPRAIAMEVPLDRDFRTSKPRRNLMEAYVNWIQLDGFPPVYVTASTVQPPQADNGQPPPIRNTRQGLPIAFPSPEPGQKLTVNFRVEAPVTAFPRESDADRVIVGFDRPEIRPLVRYADRQVRFRLQGVDTQGRLQIATSVDDYTLDMELPGLQGEYRFRVQLNVGAQRVPYPLDLVFDGRPPQFEQLETRRTTQLGEAIPVRVRLRDAAGIESVQLGLADSPSGPMLKAATWEVTHIQRAGNGWVAEKQLPTKDLPPGEYWLLAKAVDRVGLSAELSGSAPVFGAARPQSIRIAPRIDPSKANAAKGESNEPPYEGTLHGVVTVGPRATADRITVTMKGGKPRRPVRSANGGKFKFDEVPLGSYQFDAEGNVNNRPYVGSAEIELSSEEDYDDPVIIPLEPK